MNSAYVRMMKRRALRRNVAAGILILASWALWGYLMMTVVQT